MKELPVLAFILLALTFNTPGSAGPVDGLPSAIAGDDAFVKMQYREADEKYRSELAVRKDSAEVLWRIARLRVCQGDIAEESAKESWYREAAAYARRGIAADSTIGRNHTWLAASIGSIAMYEGGKTKIKLSHEIKAALDRAVALDSTDDVAYSIMGSFYLALGNISWVERQLAAIFLGSLPAGGFPEAERALTRAVRLAPEIVRHRYELGLLYHAEDRDAEAREQFRLCGTLSSRLGSDDRTKGMAADWVKRLAD
jgi:tetratricopeptide (TPR) repeat protein